MPRGQLIWYDDNLGRGRIEDSSGQYSVQADDMATDARKEGAFVHYDVERDEPNNRAVNVTLDTGTRNQRDQNRFGDSDPGGNAP